jgi:hypothetical protein
VWSLICTSWALLSGDGEELCACGQNTWLVPVCMRVVQGGAFEIDAKSRQTCPFCLTALISVSKVNRHNVRLLLANLVNFVSDDNDLLLANLVNFVSDDNMTYFWLIWLNLSQMTMPQIECPCR